MLPKTKDENLIKKNFFDAIFVNLLNNLRPIQIFIVCEKSVVEFN